MWFVRFWDGKGTYSEGHGGYCWFEGHVVDVVVGVLGIVNL